MAFLIFSCGILAYKLICFFDFVIELAHVPYMEFDVCRWRVTHHYCFPGEKFRAKFEIIQQNKIQSVMANHWKSVFLLP